MPERTGCNLRCNASEVCFYALVTVDPSMWNLNNQLENAIYPLINGFVGYIFQGQRLNCMFAHDDNKLIHGVGCHATNQRLVTDGNQMKRNLAQAVHAVHSPTGKALWVFVKLEELHIATARKPLIHQNQPVARYLHKNSHVCCGLCW